MSNVYLFPIILFSLCVSAFFGTSLATVLQGYTFIPYISEGGSYLPQSCVFSQIVNLACVFLGIVIYIRFRQIELLASQHTELDSSIRKLNDVTLWFGYGSCFGLNIVANYQLTSVPKIHYFGAFHCFFLGIIYFWMQAHISRKLYPHTGSSRMIYIRYSLSAFAAYFFSVSIFTSCEFIGILTDPDTSCKYLSASVSSEWAVAMIFCFYILSFTWEFQRINVNQPPVFLIDYEEYKRMSSNENESNV